MNKLLSMLEIQQKEKQDKVTLIFSESDFELDLLTEKAQSNTYAFINNIFSSTKPDPKQLDLFQIPNVKSNKDFIETLRLEYSNLIFTPYYCDAFGS